METCVGLKQWPVAVWDLYLAPITKLFTLDVLLAVLVVCFKLLMEWVTVFLIIHGRWDRCEMACNATGIYAGCRSCQGAYSELLMWSAIAIHSLVKILLPCLTAGLPKQSTGERSIFPKAIKCVSMFVDFYMMC